jgi:hypothetical protein
MPINLLMNESDKPKYPAVLYSIFSEWTDRDKQKYPVASYIVFSQSTDRDQQNTL